MLDVLIGEEEVERQMESRGIAFRALAAFLD